MNRLVVTLAVESAAVEPLGVKEALAMDLEKKYGGLVRVVRVDVREPEQMSIKEG